MSPERESRLAQNVQDAKQESYLQTGKHLLNVTTTHTVTTAVDFRRTQ